MENLRLMPVCILSFFSFLLLSTFVFQSATAQSKVNYLQSFCWENGHYAQGSLYQDSLQLLLSNLTAKAKTNKFYNYTTEFVQEKNETKVRGLFLCNSALSNQICQNCVMIAAGEIQTRCPSNVQSIVWYLECMLWYSNVNIFSRSNVGVFYYYNLNADPENYSEFNNKLIETFVSLFNESTSGNSTLMSAIRTDIALTSDVSMTCYVECTPDLSPLDCRRCLQTALNRLPKDGTASRVLLQPSCRLLYAFNSSKILKSTPPAVAPSSHGEVIRYTDKRLYIGLGVISAVAAAAVLTNVLLCLMIRRKAKPKPSGLYDSENMESLKFEFEAIKEATDNFATENILGQGGFGDVYKGKLANEEVAIKRLSNTSGQGIREFKTEACLAAKLRHKNLVKLFGFCLEENEMLLIYEFVVNKSLDRFLYDKTRAAYLTWETRFKIIVGIARGLLYLHEDSSPKIIHRDLKPSNILLDGEMNPKIADFGLAKLFGGGQTHGNTSRIAGTFGYIAPEYAIAGHFSDKSDIFSYGVILLEIVSGIMNSCSNPYGQNADQNLLNYAWKLWSAREHMKLLDSTLGSDFSKAEVERSIHVGLLCVQEDPDKRPSMASVLLLLNTEPITLPPPESPPAFPHKREKSEVSYGSTGLCSENIVTNSLSPR